MADLGNIVTLDAYAVESSPVTSYPASIIVYSDTAVGYTLSPIYRPNSLAIDTSGVFNGTVSINLTPTSFKDVFLYDRVTGLKIDGTKSKANGTYTFTGLDKTSNKYFAVAFSNDNTRNALIFDLITPV